MESFVAVERASCFILQTLMSPLRTFIEVCWGDATCKLFCKHTFLVGDMQASIPYLLKSKAYVPAILTLWNDSRSVGWRLHVWL